MFIFVGKKRCWGYQNPFKVLNQNVGCANDTTLFEIQDKTIKILVDIENEDKKSTIASQELTSELNEKSTYDTGNSNKCCRNNRQQEKLEN